MASVPTSLEMLFGPEEVAEVVVLAWVPLLLPMNHDFSCGNLPLHKTYLLVDPSFEVLIEVEGALLTQTSLDRPTP